MIKEKTMTVTMRLPESFVESLKNMARKTAYEENRTFSYHDLVRQIISQFLKISKEENK